MFKTGDYAVKPGYGLCRVISIGHTDRKGSDPDRLYYTLQPDSRPEDILYIPVNGAEDSIRHPLTKDAAEHLISQIPKMKISPSKDRMRIRRYKEAISKGTPEAILPMMMEIYKTDIEHRKNKVRSASESIFLEAEKLFSPELALALGCTTDEVSEIINKQITANGR